jgi:hypothetical protein
MKVFGKFAKCGVGVLHLGYRGPSVTTHKSRHDSVPFSDK